MSDDDKKKPPSPPWAPAAEGADLDCWSPALPSALSLVGTPKLSHASRVRQEGYAERRKQFPDGEFTFGTLQRCVPYRRVDVNVPARESREVEVEVGEPINWCGLCGQTFRIAPDDPHWSTGRGPICPAPKAQP